MKIGFIVNDVMTEEAGFTTTRLGSRSPQTRPRGLRVRRGRHRLRSRTSPFGRVLGQWQQKKYRSQETYLNDLQGAKAVETTRLRLMNWTC